MLTEMTPRPDSLDDLAALRSLEAEIARTRVPLLDHPIYALVNGLPALRAFMEVHVFAVWDFMSLVKRLQRECTSTDLPWLPPRDARAARLINEVVLAEESDLDHHGKPASHFDMYLEAMQEVGANRGQILCFLQALTSGASLDEALATAEVAAPVRAFVTTNLRCAADGQPAEVAAAFHFGREDLIPEMFQRLLAAWPEAEETAPAFVHYLRRHIELDGDEHGPMARRLVAGLAAGRWEAAGSAAGEAIRTRIALWDHACERVTSFASGNP